MDKRAKKIGKFVSLAEAEERHSGQLTGRSQVELGQQKDRLSELHIHRHNYVERSADVGNIDSVLWKDYQNFLSRLDQAVRSQQQTVAECEKKLELHRRHWKAQRRRLDSLQRVMDRYQREDAVRKERLEQRSLDDIPRASGLFPDDGD